MIAKGSLFRLAKALEGLPVLGCLQGTPAFGAGIRYGDILLSVNGQRTRNFADYVAAKDLRTGGMSVVLFRDGEELALELGYASKEGETDTLSLVTELAAMRLDPSDPSEATPPLLS